jgi:hypothetical protein
MTTTRSIPCWTTSVFCSVVTDLVLIYESVTSSASAVCWLALHSWTPPLLTSELRLNRSSLHGSLYSVSVTMENVCCLSVVMETRLVLNWSVATCVNSVSIRCCGNVLTKPLPNNGRLLLLYSGFQASCHNITNHCSLRVSVAVSDSCCYGFR